MNQIFDILIAHGIDTKKAAIIALEIYTASLKK